jgi:CelD/BcsL family acetyltransferase involved in cellulose biosynthesis
MDLSCELVTEFSGLERLAPEWTRLFMSQSPEGGVFQSWAWARAYWTTHGDALSLCAPVVFSGDRVVGILPLALHGEDLRLLGSPYSDYNGLLCGAEAAGLIVAAAFTALLEAPVPWTECVLEGIPESSPLVHGGDALPSSLHVRQQLVFGEWCPVAFNDGCGLFDRLSRKTSLRRHEKWLGRRGGLRFRHIETRDEILGRHLDEFFRFRSARRAQMGDDSASASPAARPMVEALVRELDPARVLRFSVLELDGRPVAYHFGFQHAGRFTWYMPAFDIGLSDGAPGEVLLGHLLRYSHQQQLAEFDFTVGDEAYKRRFANHVRRTFTLYFYRYPRQPRVEVRRLVRSVRDRARRSPAVLAYARPVLRSLRRLQAEARGR